MSTSETEQAMEHLVSFQGAEIRKFITNEIIKISQIEKIDIEALNASVATVSKILESNKQGLTLINGLVDGMKLDISKAKDELKALIATTVAENKLTIMAELTKNIASINANVTSQISEVNKNINTQISNVNTNITTQVGNLNTSIQKQLSSNDVVIKELARKQEINTGKLCDMFSKSLWGYTDFIKVNETLLQFVTPEEVSLNKYSVLNLKVSGDHFNPSSSGFDVSEQGSPFIKIIVNGKPVLTQQIKAVKMFNQFEIFNLVVEKITTLEVVFVKDAYEGGTDINKDGISEDRNLYLFECNINDVSVKAKMLTKVADKLNPFQECLCTSNSLVYNV